MRICLYFENVSLFWKCIFILKVSHYFERHSLYFEKLSLFWKSYILFWESFSLFRKFLFILKCFLHLKKVSHYFEFLRVTDGRRVVFLYFVGRRVETCDDDHNLLTVHCCWQLCLHYNVYFIWHLTTCCNRPVMLSFLPMEDKEYNISVIFIFRSTGVTLQINYL